MFLLLYKKSLIVIAINNIAKSAAPIVYSQILTLSGISFLIIISIITSTNLNPSNGGIVIMLIINKLALIIATYKKNESGCVIIVAICLDIPTGPANSLIRPVINIPNDFIILIDVVKVSFHPYP